MGRFPSTIDVIGSPNLLKKFFHGTKLAFASPTGVVLLLPLLTTLLLAKICGPHYSLFHVASPDKIASSYLLMPDQKKRLAKAARKQGISQNAFIEAAIMRSVGEVEESLNRGKAFDREERQETATKKQPVEGSFGALTSSLQKQNTNAALAENPLGPAEVPQVAAPVVVNVGHNGNNASDIDRLAAYVAAGSEIERSMRLQMAVSIIKATTPTEEEQNTLAAKLDEAIARKTNTITPANQSGFISQVARIGFDKLRSIMK